jgi:hypothetical protein
MHWVSLLSAARIQVDVPLLRRLLFLPFHQMPVPGGMGDAGVAISPDANAIYWNPAKLAFLEKKLV